MYNNTMLYIYRVQELTEQLDYVKGEQKQMAEDLAYKENEIEVQHGAVLWIRLMTNLNTFSGMMK